MHGLENRGLDVPRGMDPPEGRFGRMFPNLPVRPPTGLGLATKLGLPGGLMDGGQTTKEQENPEMDAGITFLGQFIDHNITFDPTSSLARQMDPTAVRNFRSPRLDLDHLYGSGPGVDPQLYDTTSHGTKLAHADSGADLARTGTDIALIGDPRNDENLLLAQFHLAFIKFHNKVVDELAAGTVTDVLGNRFGPAPGGDPAQPDPDSPIAELLEPRGYYDDLLAAAQQLVRWHFQWIVVHEFLPTVCGADIVDDVLRNGRRYYRPDSQAFIPVEFSVAAFRFGHPTLRSMYVINDDFTASLFPTDPGAPLLPRTDLRGGPVTPRFALDYSTMFSTNDSRRPQRAKRITAQLNTFLLDLPFLSAGDVPAEIPPALRSLAVRNLLRSETLELPSGQDVARRIGATVLTEQELGLPGPAYLWYYLLKEAEVRHHGVRMGEVGGRIIAEVLIGLLDLDPTSYLATFPNWRPTLGIAGEDGRFGIADLLHHAGVA